MRAHRSVKITHFHNPTKQRLGVRIKGGKSSDTLLAENSAMARNPKTRKMENWTAVIPSVMQGNLDQTLVPIHGSANLSTEQEAALQKWKGLTTDDLTNGLMEVRMPDSDGAQRTVMYNVPLVKDDGQPQPVAYMLEKNREQFPGFRGDEISKQIHDYNGQQYYSVPPK